MRKRQGRKAIIEEEDRRERGKDKAIKCEEGAESKERKGGGKTLQP